MVIAASLGFPLFLEPNSGAVDLFATAGLTHFLRRRITHHIGVTSFRQKLAFLIDVPSKAKDTWCSRAFHFSGDGETGNSSKNEWISHSKTSNGEPQNDKKWTNILLAVNILAFFSSVASKGKLLQWGAKINGLIDQGQLWRLVTSSFLHANVGHLLINCYSLNSIGPTVEKISGTRRFLGVYFASAIASSYVSYWFCKAPSVGASGAIFGLVGSFAVFVARHRKVFGRGKEDLQPIVFTIILNMTIGIMSRGIDNWGHFGGFVGGVVTSWLLGPAWKQEPNGRRTFIDRAPIFYLINGRRRT